MAHGGVASQEKPILSGNDIYYAIQGNQEAKVSQWMKEDRIFHKGSCRFHKTDQISTVSYYKLHCGLNDSPHFIHYGKGKKIQFSDYWKIRKWETIGKSRYIVIEFISTHTPETEPSGIHFSTSRRNSVEKDKESHLRKNKNLEIYLEFLKMPEKEDKLKGNMDVFFDKTCPLRYISANHEFYWDNIILHEFEVTCVNKRERNSIIRIRANPLGQLPLDNRLTSLFKPGEKFIAQLSIESWRGEKIQWSNARLYSYE